MIKLIVAAAGAWAIALGTPAFAQQQNTKDPAATTSGTGSPAGKTYRTEQERQRDGKAAGKSDKRAVTGSSGSSGAAGDSSMAGGSPGTGTTSGSIFAREKNPDQAGVPPGR